MDQVVRLSIGSAVISGLLVCGGLQAEEAPKRKGGLWDVSVVLSGMATPQRMQVCIGKDQDIDPMGLRPDLPCSRRVNRREGGAYIVEAKCTMGSSEVVIDSRATGDFNSRYHLVINMKFDPPLGGQTNSTQTIDGEWLGACKPGQQPGQAIMPDGTVIDLTGG